MMHPNLCDTGTFKGKQLEDIRMRRCGCPDELGQDHCDKKPGHAGGHHCLDPAGGWPRRLGDPCAPVGWRPVANGDWYRDESYGLVWEAAEEFWLAHGLEGDKWKTPWAAMKAVDRRARSA